MYCDALKPVFARLIIAGSLRQRKPTLGDVEVLFTPRLETRQADMVFL
jgi:DNA polymerase/3'-5' exonuclease PolX